MKTMSPTIPTLSSIKQFKLPIHLQPQKVLTLWLGTINVVRVCTHFCLMSVSGKISSLNDMLWWSIDQCKVNCIIALYFIAPVQSRPAILCHQFNWNSEGHLAYAHYGWEHGTVSRSIRGCEVSMHDPVYLVYYTCGLHLYIIIYIYYTSLTGNCGRASVGWMIPYTTQPLL